MATLAQIFYNLYCSYQEISDADNLIFLINHVDASVYELISEATTYNDAAEILASTYSKKPSPSFARYKLISCKQQSGEPLDCYLQKLKRLSMDCNYQAESAQVHKKEAICDAFIAESA